MSENWQCRQASNADYHAYLLRLWRESPAGEWRAWLQEASTGERHGFADLIALWEFLRQQIGANEKLVELATHSPPKDREEGILYSHSDD